MVGNRIIRKKKTDTSKLDNIVAQARLGTNEREKGYREQSLKIHPWICGRCSKTFTQENLHLLTVHHIDHNHNNNPKDGSNWENLCIYCHDREHQKLHDFEQFGELSNQQEKNTIATNNPFADLKQKMKNP